MFGTAERFRYEAPTTPITPPTMARTPRAGKSPFTPKSGAQASRQVTRTQSQRSFLTEKSENTPSTLQRQTEEKPLFKTFGAESETTGLMAVKVDLFEVEDWDKRIKGLLHQKAETEKEVVLLKKQIEQQGDKFRALEETLRLTTRDLALYKAKHDTSEDLRNQLIRDKSALLADNVALKNDNKAIKARHDKLEIELQKVKLQGEREREGTLRSNNKSTSLKEMQQLRRDLQQLQTEADQVPGLRADLLAKEKALEDSRRVITLLQTEVQQAKSSSLEHKIRFKTDEMIETKAKLDDQLRLNEALRQELEEARSVSRLNKQPTIIEQPKQQKPSDQEKERLARQVEALERRIRELEKDNESLMAQLQQQEEEQQRLQITVNDFESIMEKAEETQRTTEEKIQASEERLVAARQAHKEKEINFLSEKLQLRAVEKQLREQLALQQTQLSSLTAQVQKIQSSTTAGQSFLDESVLTIWDSDDDDINQFNHSTVKSSKKARLTLPHNQESDAPIASSSSSTTPLHSKTAGSQGEEFTAMAAYASVVFGDDNDLHFAEGDKVIVTEKSDDGWWSGHVVLSDGSLSLPGRFPGTFLRSKRIQVDA